MFFKSIQNLRSSKVLKASLLYLVFSILNQFINLLYTPILTRNLSQKDYGIYSLFYSITGILSLLLMLCIPSAYSRFYHEVKNKKEYENTILNFLIFFGGMILVLVYLSSKYISELVFTGIFKGEVYIFLVGLSSYFLGLISLLTIKYSMELKAFKASILNLLNILLQYLGIIILLKVGIFNLEKIFYIKTIIPGTIFILFFIANLREYKIKIDLKYLKKTLKYSSGLILGQISTWILSLIDRQFLNSYLGLEEVAIYSLSVKIGMLINPIFIELMKKIVTPIKFKVYNKVDGKRIILSYYKLYCFLGGFVLLGISLYSKLAINILATEEYIKALYIIPIISISYFFWGLNEYYAIGIVVGNKSLLNSIIAFLAAIINIVGNIFLIPIIGIYGATISSIISYFITNELYYKCGRKYYQINLKRLEWGRFILVYLFLYAIYIFVSEKEILKNIWSEAVINVVYLASYILITFAFKFITINEIRGLKEDEVNRNL